jgi:hypothetical protein
VAAGWQPIAFAEEGWVTDQFFMDEKKRRLVGRRLYREMLLQRSVLPDPAPRVARGGAKCLPPTGSADKSSRSKGFFGKTPRISR